MAKNDRHTGYANGLGIDNYESGAMADAEGSDKLLSFASV